VHNVFFVIFLGHFLHIIQKKKCTFAPLFDLGHFETKVL